MMHRTRKVMKELNIEMIGGKDKIVESDGAFIGKAKEKATKAARGWDHKKTRFYL